ncbi:hypothetical protein HAX54_039186 [Datura stramonium]|uniref:Uncharacterized protein n=1 Tax=Datura stramonium TaxID=4076 RepID=A0ABS8VM63_DATST|nr:hypothetical protein [Datura stramonium]
MATSTNGQSSAVMTDQNAIPTLSTTPPHIFSHHPTLHQLLTMRKVPRPKLAPRKIDVNKEEGMKKGKLTCGKIVENPEDWNTVTDRKIDTIDSSVVAKDNNNTKNWVDNSFQDQENNATTKPRLEEPPAIFCGERREEVEGIYYEEEEVEVHNSVTPSKD